MPRKSASALITTPAAHARSRQLAAPSDISAAARAHWHAIVSTTPAEQFKASDAPLLKSFCEACVLSDQAAQHLEREGAVLSTGRASAWLVVQEKAVRAQTALALRLRLCPSARLDPKTVGRAKGENGLNVDFTRLEK